MPDIPMILLLLAVLLVAANLLQPLAERLGMPHTVLLAGLGIGLGAITAASSYLTGFGLAGAAVDALGRLELTAETILSLFLPVLLFQAGLTIDVRRMLDDLAPILMLAVVAVLVCSVFVGLALTAVSDAGLVVCLMLGAIIATTDPVAVIGIFRDLGAPRRLSILIEGESLFNDAAAIALFAVLMGVLLTGSEAGAGATALLFARSFVGGFAAGWIGARLGLVLLRAVRDLPLAETTVTVALAYLVYVVSEAHLGVSGVVAVVTAALVTGASARIRLSSESWRRLVDVWSQLGSWAATLIFLFASMLVPRFLEGVGLYDAALLGVLVLAALAARAVVLWGLLPALAAVGLGARVGAAYRAVILWGGLRGAVTLALALAVTENVAVPPEVKRFVAVLATGFVLFTLLVNGTTLRPVIRLLGLDRLDPVDEALRNRAIALALDTVADRIRETARDYHLPDEMAEQAQADYRARSGDVALDDWDRLGARKRISVGLLALTGREEALYLEHSADHVISRRLLLALVAKAGRLRDGAKTGGLGGYARAAEDSLRFPAGFRIAHALHRFLRVDGPLARRLADRFETLLITRLVLEQLIGFARSKLGPLLGGAAGGMETVLGRRLEDCERALEAMRLQYPDYAGALERRFLRQAALRMEEVEYRGLLAESAISPEIHADLQSRLDAERRALARRPPLDLGLDTADLVRRFPMFEGLPESERDAIGSLLRSRFAYPGERLIGRGERGDAMYLISSGAVEVRLPAGPVRLGRGDFFGELALLTNRRRSADVFAIGYCRLLALNGRDFRRFLKTHPVLRARIRTVAEERLRQPDEAAA